MANLTTLPNELLILIFTNCSIRWAFTLAAANNGMRQIWMEHNKVIVETILERDIPAWKDAFTFAEIEWEISHPHETSQDTRSPVYPWLPRLLRNAELASTVCHEWTQYLAECSPSNWRLKETYEEPYEASYYIIRRLKLAFNHRELLPAIRTKLASDTYYATATHYCLGLFTRYGISDDMQHAHAMPKPEDQWDIDDELSDNPYVDEWEHNGPLGMLDCAHVGDLERLKYPFPCEHAEHVYHPPIELDYYRREQQRWPWW